MTNDNDSSVKLINLLGSTIQDSPYSHIALSLPDQNHNIIVKTIPKTALNALNHILSLYSIVT